MAPPAFRTFVNKRCTCTWNGRAGWKIKVVDWATFKGKRQLVADVFGDIDVGTDFPMLIGEGPVWKSTKVVPFALLGEQHGADDGQLAALLLHDVGKPDGAVYLIEVDGTAVPEKKPERLVSSFAALEVIIAAPPAKEPRVPGGLSFDARATIRAGHLDGDARKLLAKLSGDKDSGVSYVSEHIVRKPTPPKGRDPRWIDALREELANAIVRASASYQDDPYMFAGTLVSFGRDALPALVAAFDEARTKYPARSLGYGVEPVLKALAALGSDAGIPGALDIIERSPKPEKTWAMESVLTYLKRFHDHPRVRGVVKRLAARPAIKKAPYWDTLDELVTALG